MPAATSDLFKKTGASTVTTLAAPGKALGATSITVGSTTNYPSDTGIIIAIRVVDTNGELVAGTYTEWSATVSSGTSLAIEAVPVYGSDQIYAAGSTTQVFIPLSSYAHNKLIDGILTQHKQTGAHGDITADNATITNATIANLTVGGQTPSPDWTAIATPPNTVTYNGQRSYSLVFNGVNYTNILSPGQRIRTTRTVAAPTQCTSLNGTTQYWNKTSPNKLTFTDDFVVDVYVKLTSYTTAGFPNSVIASRYNGTSGFMLWVTSTGQVRLQGFNTGASNTSYIESYQSIPLNKWVRISAQLDMSTFTATPTTSYVMIDGIDVPSSLNRAGSNPTALIQAGNLEIGSTNGGTGLFPGKIAQVAIYNAKVTQANIILAHSQGLIGTETSLVSAYSFNGVATDLNTTTPNDLTAQGSAVATNADSPFGTQASGLISSTLDYGIVQSATFSTNTTVVVQVPEGCTIPTSGGVSVVSYSGLKSPYGFPSNANKWRIAIPRKTSQPSTSNATYGAYAAGGWAHYCPIGTWKVGYIFNGAYTSSTTAVIFGFSPTALTGLADVAGANVYNNITSRLFSPSAAAMSTTLQGSITDTFTTAQTFVMYSIGAITTAVIDGSTTLNETYIENAYL